MDGPGGANPLPGQDSEHRPGGEVREAPRRLPVGDGGPAPRFDIPLSSVYNKGMAETPFMPIINYLERTEKMEKIASFTIDHIKLKPGVYVSRKDHVGTETITTFDLRMTSPNDEPVMNTAEVHTIEHLGATFLRNHPVFGSKTVYFGPMGCRTGFYLLLAGDYESRDIVELIKEMFIFIRDFKDEVPGASPKDCGNYLDMNLGMANYLAKKYLDEVLTDISEDRLVYPE